MLVSYHLLAQVTQIFKNINFKLFNSNFVNHVLKT